MASQPTSPVLPLHSCLRLGLFQACLGCLAVIFAGLLNRVMLSELGYPGLLVGGALAFEQFVAPSRVLFGQISDAHPLGGRHRVPYVLLGTALFCSAALLVVPLIFHVADLLRAGAQPALALGIGALCGLFAVYGLAISLATTPYLALVIDRTTETERPKVVGIIWCMLTVGIVVGAIVISLTLRSLDGVRDPAVLEPTLARFMARVAAVVMALTVLATWGIEPRETQAGSRGGFPRDDAITMAQAWRLITSSSQILIFFSFLILFTLALFLQDPILESYGAQVFGMPIAATAQLNAFWGVGTLCGLLIAGSWVVPRMGKLPATRLGCRLIVLCLLLLLFSGPTESVPLLKVVMLLFGLAAGFATNGALCLMLDLTLPQAAATFVGVWGLAQALARAFGKVIGGGLLDLGNALPLPAGSFPPFALVFSVEVLVALAALWVLSRLNLGQFREDTRSGLGETLTLELG